MAFLNIILLEDDKVCRDDLMEGLTDEYGHKVKGYWDVESLRNDDRSGKILHGFDKGRMLIMILDVMLAFRSTIDAVGAPRRKKTGLLTPGEALQFVDEELGMKVAKYIRDTDASEVDKFKSLRPDIPILFLTARHQDDLVREIESIDRAKYLAKPVFVDEVEEALQELALQVI